MKKVLVLNKIEDNCKETLIHISIAGFSENSKVLSTKTDNSYQPILVSGPNIPSVPSRYQ